MKKLAPAFQETREQDGRAGAGPRVACASRGFLMLLAATKLVDVSGYRANLSLGKARVPRGHHAITAVHHGFHDRVIVPAIKPYCIGQVRRALIYVTFAGFTVAGGTIESRRGGPGR